MAQICEIFNKQQFMGEAMHGELWINWFKVWEYYQKLESIKEGTYDGTDM